MTCRMRGLGVTLALAALGAGCGDGMTPAATGTSAYIVPGPPDVSYPIEPAEVAVEGSELRIGYNLPALLVGTSQKVSLRGPLDATQQMAQVSGAAGTGVCNLAPGGGLTLRCTENLTGVTVDLAAVQKVAMEKDPQNVAARIATASKFAGEPIGILEVR